MNKENIRSVWVDYCTKNQHHAVVVNLKGCEDLPKKAVEYMAIAVVCYKYEVNKYVKIISAEELDNSTKECDFEC